MEPGGNSSRAEKTSPPKRKTYREELEELAVPADEMERLLAARKARADAKNKSVEGGFLEYIAHDDGLYDDGLEDVATSHKALPATAPSFEVTAPAHQGAAKPTMSMEEMWRRVSQLSEPQK